MQRVPRILSFFLVLLVACASGEIKPVPIESSDMCSFCRMAISEKQFAAEIIAADETVLKFDDVGCMLRYRDGSGGKLKAAAIFVTDYDTRQWLKAEDAFFTRSKSVKTPMGSGLIAYADRSKAGADASSFSGLKP